MTGLHDSLDVGEEQDGSVELKERLTHETHLVDGKRESLSAQMRHRVLSGNGEATYVIGVTDDEGVAGIPPHAFSETVEVLSEIAEGIGSHVHAVESWETERGLVGTVTIGEDDVAFVDDSHLIVGTAGHVDHGKSSLIGAMITGETDDGDGAMRQYLDLHPHEVERGLSSDLSFAVYGFDEDGPIRLDNPNRDSDRARIVEESDRVVSFVDTVGHQPWLRTTIRGIVGQQIDYGLLTVAVDDGPTKTTREHLGILFATDIPTVIAITKADVANESRVEQVELDVAELVRNVGKTPLLVHRSGIDAAIEEVSESVVPIFTTSAVTGEGLDDLDEFFQRVPRRSPPSSDEEFRLYIDRIYSVTGVGPVVSGTVKSGAVEVGDSLQLGPFQDGTFRTVEVRSIETHYHRVDKATAGHMIGMALKGVETEEIERGMVLIPEDEERRVVRGFEAEIAVLNHPTRIQSGYEPVIHLETIQESAVFHPETENGQLLPGSKGPARVAFKFRPYFVEEGQTFVFRESESKGVGTVTSIMK